MSAARHPEPEALHDLLDGRLHEPDRAGVMAHLETCVDCRRAFDALSLLTRHVGASLRAEAAVPEDLEARLRLALDEEDRQPRRATEIGQPGRKPWRWAAWAAAAVAATIAVVLVWGPWRPSPPAPAEVAQDLRRYLAGDFVLDTRTADVRELQRHLDTAALGFPTRVFDLGMMAYRLEGGGVHRVTGRPSALFAYAGPEAQRLLCQMYAGTVTALPPPAERRTHEGTDFLIYREGDVTVVFWQEGDVVCALAANGDAEAAIRLAFAKATRV
jgi:anti-sigma factor RsiW